MTEATIAPPFWHPALMDAFILDWDGVLADTRLDFTALRRKYFGGRIVPLIETADALPPPLREEVKAEIRRIEMEGAERAVPVDGAREFLAWLRRSGKPWAVVSRNCRDSILLAAERCGIALPPVLLSREDPAVKPEPEALALASERLGIALDNCVMVGDFVYDMLGARRAAVRCVLVERDPEEWGHLADAAYPRLRDFLSALETPSALVPWEYRALAEERGEAYLRAQGQCLWHLPEQGAYRLAVRLARRGAVRLTVPEGARLRMEDWKNSELPPRHIDRPLADVLREVLSQRWPSIQILSDPPSGLRSVDVRGIADADLDAFLLDVLCGDSAS